MPPPWFNPSYGSSDLFNKCCTSLFVGVPINWWGYQFARTGDGYAGGYFNFNSDFREYIEQKMKEPMIAGGKYCVNFYVNLSDSSKFAISSIGVCFTVDTLKADTSGPLPCVPQIQNSIGSYIEDKAGWVLVSGTYTAIGGENFITIGNFYDKNNTSAKTLSSGTGAYSYYYVDDVVVMLCDDTLKNDTVGIKAPNIFTPNNDGVNDVFKVQVQNAKTYHCVIYNRWGVKVFESTELNKSWDGHTQNGMPVNDGVYYYVITFTGKDDKMYNKKGFVEVVR